MQQNVFVLFLLEQNGTAYLVWRRCGRQNRIVFRILVTVDLWARNTIHPALVAKDGPL